MLKKNYLKEKLDANKKVIGTFAIIPSPVVADIISSTGMDFIVIDGEHGPINFETAQTMVMACESHHVSPAIRVSGVIESEILKALDVGAHCLHVPNITTRKDIEQTVMFSKYPPLGRRGFSPFTRAGGYSLEFAKNNTKLANQNTLLAVHIEGKDTIENIDSIMKIKELDIVFVGLFDMSKSLGIPGEVSHPKVLDLLQRIVDKTNRAGKKPGTIATNPEQLEKFFSYGVKYITYSVDCDIICASFKKINQAFRKVYQS